MNPTEAAQLADTLTRSWPQRGVDPDVLATKLATMDYLPALNAIAALADREERPPSIAQFSAEYRAHAAPLRTYLREDCARCGGSGWEIIETQRPGYPTPTTGVVPCRCSNGRLVTEAHQRAVEHNETELRRTRPLNATSEAAA